MNRWKAYVGLILAVTFWGASFIATKILLRDLGPAALVFYRFSMGFAVLLAAAIWRRDLLRVPAGKLPILILLGFMGVTFHVWLQATGLQTASATTTAWIVATTPIFVAIISRLFLKEALSSRRLGGIALAAVGALLVVTQGDLAHLLRGRIGTPGDLLIVCSSINWALFTVLSKAALDPQRPLGQLVYVTGIGWMLSIPWAVFEGGMGHIAVLAMPGWLALVFLGVFCSGFAFLFWYQGLAEVEATQVGAFLYFEPLVTTLLARPILGEAWGVAVLMGGAAILAGVGLVNRG